MAKITKLGVVIFFELSAQPGDNYACDRIQALLQYRDAHGDHV